VYVPSNHKKKILLIHLNSISLEVKTSYFTDCLGKKRERERDRRQTETQTERQREVYEHFLDPIYPNTDYSDFEF